MRIDKQDSHAYSALLDVKEALLEECRVWLNDIAFWVKDEIDQDPKNLGKNYEHFLIEQAKVVAHQTGLQKQTITALIHQEFEMKNRRDIHSYACEQWQAHLFKSDPRMDNQRHKTPRKINAGPER